ncbi:MAG TPA: response regulator [Gemmatimonadales bacterium]|nr:response regulator [Gemmatimonadales bacterium]
MLIVDDERNIRKTLSICLKQMGCQVSETRSSASAMEAIAYSHHDVAFVDLRLGNENGLDLLPMLLARRPGLYVIAISAHGTIDIAAEALKRGAKCYLPKPFTPSEIRRALESARASQSDSALL